MLERWDVVPFRHEESLCHVVWLCFELLVDLSSVESKVNDSSVFTEKKKQWDCAEKGVPNS